MIIYTNKCLACLHRKRVRAVKEFARQHKMKVEERRTSYSTAWQREAARYGLTMPFIAHEDKAVALYGDLETLLTPKIEVEDI